MGGGSPSEDWVTNFNERESDHPVQVSKTTTTSKTIMSPLLRIDDDDAGGVEMARLLYSKSKVYIHPTTNARDNLPGFLSITQLSNSTEVLLAWIPESAIQGTQDYESYVLVELEGNPDAPTLITPPTTSFESPLHAFSFPIRSLYSIILQPPTITSWFGSISLHLFSGDVVPPLYFHDDESHSTMLDRDRRVASKASSSSSSRPGSTSPMPPSWGGDSVINQIRSYANVVRSSLEPNLFLINPSRADLEVHSTTLFEDEAVPTQALSGMRLNGGGANGRNSILHQSLSATNDYPDDFGAPVDNVAFSVLSSFSRITRGARSVAQTAAQSVLSHPLAKPILKSVPPPLAQFANVPGELTRLQETAGVAGYDSARIYLAHWARVVAEEGEKARKREVVVRGGRGGEEVTSVGAFEVLASTYKISRPKSTRASAQPIVATEWTAWFDERGKLMLPEAEAKRRIFQRGLAPGVRRDVWPFLLGVLKWDSTTKERSAVRAANSIEYQRLKRIWSKDEELMKTTTYSEESHRIEIDCRRTDRTHPLFESNELDPPDLEQSDYLPSSPNLHVRNTEEILLTYVFGAPDRDYVQGMSDLLSPIYVVNTISMDDHSRMAEEDESMTYWEFTELMKRMESNFGRDQVGMKTQLSQLQCLIALMDPVLYKHFEITGSLNLFFCFRWILCSFKRELSFNDTLRLWEVLWTDHLGTHFHLFVALAILEMHRDVIVRYLREFDEILKYINELSQTLDIESILNDAEVLFITFQRVVAASDAASASSATRSLSTVNGGTVGVRNRKGSIIELSIGGSVPEIEEGLRVLLT